MGKNDFSGEFAHKMSLDRVPDVKRFLGCDAGDWLAGLEHH